jgi:hypothetical protein
MNKAKRYNKTGIAHLLNEQERAILSPETKKKLFAYERYILENLHGLYKVKKDEQLYTIENGFYCLAGFVYDDDLKAAFFSFLSPYMVDVPRLKLPSPASSLFPIWWRAWLQVLLLHYCAPEFNPNVNLETCKKYLPFAPMRIIKARDILINWGLLKRSGWRGHYYISKEARTGIAKILVEIERRKNSFIVDQISQKKEKQGPDWESM